MRRVSRPRWARDEHIIPQRRKTEQPRGARVTMGSTERLNDVLSRTGIPVRRPYASSSACAAAPCHTQATAACRSIDVRDRGERAPRHSGRTGTHTDMKRASRRPPRQLEIRSPPRGHDLAPNGRNSSRYCDVAIEPVAHLVRMRRGQNTAVSPGREAPNSARHRPSTTPTTCRRRGRRRLVR